MKLMLYSVIATGSEIMQPGDRWVRTANHVCPRNLWPVRKPVVSLVIGQVVVPSHDFLLAVDVIK